VIGLRAVPKKLRASHHWDSAQCCKARSHLYLRIALRIRNHMQKSFSLLISDPSGIDWWKNQMSKISWDCLFKCNNKQSFAILVYCKELLNIHLPYWLRMKGLYIDGRTAGSSSFCSTSSSLEKLSSIWPWTRYSGGKQPG
jgi:hypothetical protein